MTLDTRSPRIRSIYDESMNCYDYIRISQSLNIPQITIMVFHNTSVNIPLIINTNIDTHSW